MTTQPPQDFADEQRWIGQHIGNYRLLRIVGEGGMGIVFEALHEGAGGRAAVKILRPGVSSRSDLAARFFNEARAANAIKHPGIVRIFDSGYTHNQVAFLTMEFLDGESLRERINRVVRMPLVVMLRIGRQLASALVACHRKGIIHRDLKPDNVMLVADPDLPGGECVKVLDFGIAKMAESFGALAHATEINSVLGTPAYMSPEQCRGAKLVTDRADVYSLGTILYQLLAGRTPFVAEGVGGFLIMQLMEPVPPLSSFVPDIEPAAAALIHAMLAKDATARPDMEGVLAAIQQLEKNAPAESPTARDPEPTQPLSLRQLRPALPAATAVQPTIAAQTSASAATPQPRLHGNTVTGAASEVTSGHKLAKPNKRSVMLIIGAGVAITGLALVTRFIGHPPPADRLHTAVVKPLARDTPPVEKTAPPVEKTAPALPLEPPALPLAKGTDVHYAAARRHFDTKRYDDAINDAARCSREYAFQCSLMRAKAACHTPNHAPVQAVLDALKESHRADKDRAVQEIRAECQSDALDTAEKLLAEKQYMRAQTVARINQELHPDRAWDIMGRVACAIDDRPTMAQASAKLQAAPDHLAAMESFCKGLSSHPDP